MANLPTHCPKCGSSLDYDYEWRGEIGPEPLIGWYFCNWANCPNCGEELQITPHYMDENGKILYSHPQKQRIA